MYTPTRSRGFTLIEILVVVAIIMILSSIVLVGLGPIQRRGRDARRIADLRQVQQAVELYYSRNQTYVPTSGSITMATLTGEVGVAKLPDDPGGANPYQYASDGSTYRIGAKLEDFTPALQKDSMADAGGSTFCAQAGFYCVGN